MPSAANALETAAVRPTALSAELTFNAGAPRTGHPGPRSLAGKAQPSNTGTGDPAIDLDHRVGHHGADVSPDHWGHRPVVVARDSPLDSDLLQLAAVGSLHS